MKRYEYKGGNYKMSKNICSYSTTQKANGTNDEILLGTNTN